MKKILLISLLSLVFYISGCSFINRDNTTTYEDLKDIMNTYVERFDHLIEHNDAASFDLIEMMGYAQTYTKQQYTSIISPYTTFQKPNYEDDPFHYHFMTDFWDYFQTINDSLEAFEENNYTEIIRENNHNTIRHLSLFQVSEHDVFIEYNEKDSYSFGPTTHEKNFVFHLYMENDKPYVDAIIRESDDDTIVHSNIHLSENGDYTRYRVEQEKLGPISTLYTYMYEQYDMDTHYYGSHVSQSYVNTPYDDEALIGEDTYAHKYFIIFDPEKQVLFEADLNYNGTPTSDYQVTFYEQDNVILSYGNHNTSKELFARYNVAHVDGWDVIELVESDTQNYEISLYHNDGLIQLDQRYTIDSSTKIPMLVYQPIYNNQSELQLDELPLSFTSVSYDDLQTVLDDLTIRDMLDIFDTYVDYDIYTSFDLSLNDDHIDIKDFKRD